MIVQLLRQLKNVVHNVTISCCIPTLACNMFSVFCSHCDFVDESVLKHHVQWSTTAVHDSQTRQRERERERERETDRQTEREMISDWVVVVWRTRDPSQSAVAATDTTLSSNHTSCTVGLQKHDLLHFKITLRNIWHNINYFWHRRSSKSLQSLYYFVRLDKTWCDWEAHSSQTRRSTTWLFCGHSCTSSSNTMFFQMFHE